MNSEDMTGEHRAGEGRPTAPVPGQRGGEDGHPEDGSNWRMPGRQGDSRLSAGDHGRGRGADDTAGFDTDSYTKENLPPVAEHEIEIIVPDALTFAAGQSTRSESTTVGNFRFRILVFPSGTHSTAGHQVSAFVEADPLEHLDPRWVFNSVKYQVAVVNWLDYRKSVVKTDSWTFSKDGIDRGWHDMVRTADLSPELGWLGPNNSLCVRASCQVRTADGINVNSDYNFKRETGFIGLLNHGATCYMNGLLQSLFHLGDFRRIVYSIDCEDSPDSLGKDDAAEPSRVDADGDGKSPVLIEALQNVFYRLHTSDQAVNCRELMKAFGWDAMDAFTQHDAQELNRILCDRLEEQMKGTSMDGSIKRLFEGEMENYIECIDVDYRSRRNETFYDIQLNIKSERGTELRSIEDSLKDFTSEEILEGDNAYEAEGHGKQRAKKGIRFLTFPPVLNLQLKRFHFDLEKMDMVKLNTKFEFPKRLDLSSFAEGAGTYILHAVVVHSGDVNSGHYYAHIRPNMEQGWFKFDDDTVTPCSEYAAMEDNYGGADLAVWHYFDRTPHDLRSAQTPTRARIHNAYMLVYIKENMADTILKVPEPSEVNARLVERCEREARMTEQRRREKLEQQMKIKIRLVFDKDLARMSGFWEHTDIVYSSTLKMGRDQLVKELAAEVEQMAEVSRNHMAIFSLHYRNNPRQVRFAFMPSTSSLRSHIPQFSAPHFDPSDPFLTVLVCMSKGYSYSMDTYKWKPVKEGDKQPDQLAQWCDEQYTLLIVKYFCPVNRKLVTLGCNYIGTNDPLITMVTEGWIGERLKPYVNDKQVAPLPSDADSYAWECWEEFSEKDIQLRSVKKPVKAEQLWSGDVVIWQPASTRPKEGEQSQGDGASADETSGEPPVYSVVNVNDFAAMLANSVDVAVTVHDSRQPLCVDGVVSNGVWGQPRPASAAQKDAGSQKEERPEDIALASSPAKFSAPREQEIKMDLRWHLQHVTGSIARSFGLKAPEGPEPTQLWLFHAAPASTCEDPLNAHASRNEQTSLKDLQRSAMYISAPAGKKPQSLTLHAVELPPQVGRQGLDRGQCPLCLRFFDDAVREVGSAVVIVPATGTVQDVLAEAQQHLLPEWGISGPLRAMEITDGKLTKTARGPETAVRSLACFGKANIFYHCLRVEADSDFVRAESQGVRMVEIFHCDRQSQQAFAQLLLLPLPPGEKAVQVKARCKEKLRVADQEFKTWRLVRCGSRVGRTHLKDDEPWDSEPGQLCLEHVHPNPTSSFARQSRYNKPLTIK